MVSSYKEEVADFFSTMPARFDPLMVKPFDGIVQICVQDPAGIFDFQIQHTGNGVRVEPGSCPAPVAKWVVDSGNLIRISTGEISAKKLHVEGKLSISGNIHAFLGMYDLLLRTPPEVEARFRKLGERLAQRAPLTTLRRVDAPDGLRALREAALASEPIILTNIMTGWPCERWTPEELSRSVGGSRVWYADATMTETTVREFVRAMTAGPRDRPVVTGSIPTPPELLPFLGKLPCLPPEVVPYQIEMFLSAQGGVTPLHRDLTDGLLGAVFGRRRWWLYSPDQAALCYPRKNYNRYQNCMVDVQKPNLERFPLFEKARPCELVLEPGDMLFVPHGWFHYVRVEEHALAIRWNLPLDWEQGAS